MNAVRTRKTQFQLTVVLPILLTLLLPGLVFPQEATKAPLSEEDILALVTSSKLGEVSPRRVVEVITARGIGFTVTDIFLLELEAREADPSIPQALRKLREQGKDLPTAPASPSSSTGAEPPAGPSGPVSGSVSKIPTEQTWPRFLEATRVRAMAYIDDLPNFICTQITTRFMRIFPGGWREEDNFVADLTYFEKKENYKIITVANRPTTTATIEKLPGARSTGEFGSALRALFDPQTNAMFRLEGADESNGHETVRISYQVPRETSSRSINYNDERVIVTGYRGRCWLDPESYNVVRLEEKAVNIPEDFPITRSEVSIDYDIQDISGRKYWIPVRAEMMLVQGGAKLHTRNVIEFKRYRKFEAEVKIVPE